jgi:hypothetical protein
VLLPHPAVVKQAQQGWCTRTDTCMSGVGWAQSTARSPYAQEHTGSRDGGLKVGVHACNDMAISSSLTLALDDHHAVLRHGGEDVVLLLQYGQGRQRQGGGRGAGGRGGLWRVGWLRGAHRCAT